MSQDLTISKPVATLASLALGLATFAATASAQTATVSTFASGTAVKATQPDSVVVGGGSVWIEYGNGVDSTGADGKSSTIVRYSQANGAIQNTYSILGSVDGLNIDPATGTVYALQNQDGNATVSTINPATNVVSGPRSYATTSAARGYDEWAFTGGKVYGSYTNPANPDDPIVQQIQPTSNPVTATPVLTYGATGTNLATGQAGQPIVANDPDSLKVRPNGDLQLSSGDDGTLTFIHNPGAGQTVSFLQLLDANGAPVSGLDDAQTVTSQDGTFYLAETKNNDILKIDVTGLTIGDIYADVGSLNVLGDVSQSTGTVSALLSGLGSPHGLAFVESVPEPASMAALGGGLLALLAVRRRRA